MKATIVFGRSIFVQVFTDEGVTGIGETWTISRACGTRTGHRSSAG
jgi:hypothetical protein